MVDREGTKPPCARFGERRPLPLPCSVGKMQADRAFRKGGQRCPPSLLASPCARSISSCLFCSVARALLRAKSSMPFRPPLLQPVAPMCWGDLLAFFPRSQGRGRGLCSVAPCRGKKHAQGGFVPSRGVRGLRPLFASP